MTQSSGKLRCLVLLQALCWGGQVKKGELGWEGLLYPVQQLGPQLPSGSAPCSENQLATLDQQSFLGACTDCSTQAPGIYSTWDPQAARLWILAGLWRSVHPTTKRKHFESSKVQTSPVLYAARGGGRKRHNTSERKRQWGGGRGQAEAAKERSDKRSCVLSKPWVLPRGRGTAARLGAWGHSDNSVCCPLSFWDNRRGRCCPTCSTSKSQAPGSKESLSQNWCLGCLPCLGLASRVQKGN